MHKAIPNLPETLNISPYESLDSSKLHEAANRALDHYLTPPIDNPRTTTVDRSLSVFAVAPGINTEALLPNAYETFCSATTLVLDLGDDLDGKDRNLALAIHQMMELGLLLIEKALDHEHSVGHRGMV
ncbi:DUF6124 family protein [Pseudomonas fluorescens]|uniref:DUF3077 domain-containing protein n=1 Tax=Pseudomonas fluorescens TaxID=294 RepID=A0A5E7CSR0_PSEFL|nr:DUF6124 family protein [Pseudomonas fluorescens]VVN98453.1 hypothetical protein PS691_02433 [Pseudomonas fluorescens]